MSQPRRNIRIPPVIPPMMSFLMSMINVLLG
jgi:hypothetical protein